MTTESMTANAQKNSAEVGIDVQRLVLLLGDLEAHLLSVYGATVADFESAPIEEEGWMLYCEVKAAKNKILKQNAEVSREAGEKGTTNAE